VCNYSMNLSACPILLDCFLCGVYYRYFLAKRGESGKLLRDCIYNEALGVFFGV
jgi:hypothetical protein